MSLNRRTFLILGSVSGLGIIGLGKGLLDRTTSHPVPPAKAVPTTTANLSTPESVTQKTPILRFVAIADSGSGDRHQYDVAAAMSHYHAQQPYSLALLAGDNIYTNGEFEKISSVFEHPYQTLLNQGVKFHACLGNHDIRTAQGDRQVHYDSFNMEGQRYYTFREQSVQFFALETNPSADWKAQLTWLEQELAHSDAPWKIVFGHHPIYSSGRYGTNPEMVAALSPLFQKYRVQLYINGHEHDYERTHPIHGTTYVITGIGGASLRPVDKSQWTAYSASRFGFTTFEVYGDRIEVKAIGTDNQVFDQGTIPLS